MRWDSNPRTYYYDHDTLQLSYRPMCDMNEHADLSDSSDKYVKYNS